MVVWRWKPSIIRRILALVRHPHFKGNASICNREDNPYDSIQMQNQWADSYIHIYFPIGTNAI